MPLLNSSISRHRTACHKALNTLTVAELQIGALVAWEKQFLGTEPNRPAPGLPTYPCSTSTGSESIQLERVTSAWQSSWQMPNPEVSDAGGPGEIHWEREGRAVIRGVYSLSFHYSCTGVYTSILIFEVTKVRLPS